MKKKIIIFGATGNVGSYLTDYLNNILDKDEYEVIAVGKRQTNFFDRFNIKYYSVDISKEEDFDILPTKDVYAVVNLAGVLPAFMKGYFPRAYINVNIMGGFNVLDYCKKVNADRIIYSQSIADISGHLKKSPVVKPYMSRSIIMNNDHAIYSISKCAVVDMMENYHEMYGLKTFVLRLPNIYKYCETDYFYIDGVRHRTAYRQIIDTAIKGDDIELWGDPNNARDIVYVKDFCQIVYKTLFVNKDKAVYNIGTGKAVTLKEEIEGIVEVFSPERHKSKIIPKPEKPNRPGYVMDVSNLIEDLDYKPMTYIEMLKDLKKEMELKRFFDLEKSFTVSEE